MILRNIILYKFSAFFIKTWLYFFTAHLFPHDRYSCFLLQKGVNLGDYDLKDNLKHVKIIKKVSKKIKILTNIADKGIIYITKTFLKILSGSKT